MAPKIFSRQSQGRCTAIVRLLWSCCWMTARYLCDFMGTARALKRHPCNNCARVVQMSHISIKSVWYFWQHVHRKLCVCCTVKARLPNGALVENVQRQLVYVYGLPANDFKHLYIFFTKILKATELVNPYKLLPTTACLRSEKEISRLYWHLRSNVNLKYTILDTKYLRSWAKDEWQRFQRLIFYTNRTIGAGPILTPRK